MARYIDADKLNRKKKYLFRTQEGAFPKSEWFIKADNLFSEPTADVVEVKHGEWKYDHWCEFKCSVCGHWSQTEPRGKENYCPHCGARMDGGKAE